MSVGPWQYDEEVLSISHKLFKRRAQEIFPHLQTAVKEFLHTGLYCIGGMGRRMGCRGLWIEIAPLLSGSCTLPGRVDGQPWFSSIS